jgi:hypothetical protein
MSFTPYVANRKYSHFPHRIARDLEPFDSRDLTRQDYSPSADPGRDARNRTILTP